MSQARNDLKAEFDKSLAQLQTLRDQVRVKIHLAGLDAKAEWTKLQPRLEAAEKTAVEAAAKAAGDVSAATKSAVDDAVKALKEFRANFKA
jgi:hypothetical protein